MNCRLDCSGFAPMPAIEGQINVAPNVCGPNCCEGTVQGYLFASNFFSLCVDGQFVKSDPVLSQPLQKVSFSFTPEESGTREYAMLVQDSLDGSLLSAGGVVGLFSDGTTTSTEWKCKVIQSGPPAQSMTYDSNWYAKGYDFSSWSNAVNIGSVPLSGTPAIYNPLTAQCSSATSSPSYTTGLISDMFFSFAVLKSSCCQLRNVSLPHPIHLELMRSGLRTY